MSNRPKAKMAPSRHRPPSWRIVLVILIAGMLIAGFVGALVTYGVNQQMNPVTARSGAMTQGETTVFGSLTVAGETEIQGPLAGNDDGYIWLRDNLVVAGDGESYPQLTLQGAHTQTVPLLRVQGIDGRSDFEMDAQANISTTGSILFEDGMMYPIGSRIAGMKVIYSTSPITVTGSYVIQNYHNVDEYDYTGIYSGDCSLVAPPTANAASCVIRGGMWPIDQGFQLKVVVYNSSGITSTVATPINWYAFVQP